MKTLLILVCFVFLPIAMVENSRDLENPEHYSLAKKLEEQGRELEKAIQKIKRGEKRNKQLKAMMKKIKEKAAEQTKLQRNTKEKGIINRGDKKERKGKGKGYRINSFRRNKTHKNRKMIKNTKHGSKRRNKNNKGKRMLTSKIKNKEARSQNKRGSNTARKPKLEARVNKSKRKNLKRSKNKRKLPACNAAGCPLSTIVTTIKKYTKVENTLRKLSRMVKWWTLLNSRSNSSLTTFQASYDAMSDATDGGTTCGSDPINSNPDAKMTHDQLSGCALSSSSSCKTSGILYEKNLTDCTNPPGCSAETSCSAGTVCNARDTCKKGCNLAEQCSCDLTQEIIDHANNFCIPQLSAWSKRYRACYSKLTYSNCKTPCQSNTNLFQCQRDECELCGGPTQCGFEECLVNAQSDSNVELNCQCDCFRSLDFEHTNVKSHDELNYPEFAVSTTRFCDCNLDCFGIAEFERKVQQRRSKCLTASKNHDSGNFADCRYHGRNVPKYIKPCRKPCNSTIDPASTTSSTPTGISSTFASTAPPTTMIEATTSSATSSTLDIFKSVATSTTTISTAAISTAAGRRKRALEKERLWARQRHGDDIAARLGYNIVRRGFE